MDTRPYFAAVLAFAFACELAHCQTVKVHVGPASAPAHEPIADTPGPSAPSAEPIADNNGVSQTPQPCMDESGDCAAWAARGECAANQAYMRTACRASCGVCMPTAAERAAAERRACADVHPMCATWASIGECETNPNFMKEQCRVACRLCQSDACHDTAPDCAARAVGGGCYTGAMREECAWTCVACSVRSEPRCARDRSVAPAAVKGSVNAMFKRIAGARDLGAFRNSSARVLSTSPWVAVIDDFLSAKEADALLAAGGVGWSRSLAGDGEQAVRTSSTAWCRGKCMSDPVVDAVQQRVTQLTGVPTEHGEWLQVLRYREGEFYKTHHDQNSPRASAWGPRLYTFYMYLADVARGGGTHFPRLNVTVAPKKGRAVLWPSVLDEDPFERDDRTDHEALPPEGEGAVKYGCNFWLHMFPFRELASRGCDNAPVAENWY